MKRLGLALTAVLLLSGCTLDITEWQVPGGSATGHTYVVKAVFADVENLIPQAQVRQYNVAVGDVTDISLADDDTVVVTMKLSGNVKVPTNVVAELGSTSLLGEMFIDLKVPDGQTPTGELPHENTVIAEGRTNLVPQFEQSLAALSTVLNGSGLGQLQSIVRELNTAFDGRVPAVRSLIEQLTRVVGTVDTNKDSLTGLLDRLDGLTTTLARQKGTLELALTALAPGIRAVNASIDDIGAIFTHIDALGQTAQRVLSQTNAATVADLTKLRPVVETLVGVRGDLVTALDRLGRVEPLIKRAIPGDFANISGSATLALGDLLELLQQAGAPTAAQAAGTTTTRARPPSATPPRAPRPVAPVPAPAPTAPGGLAQLLDLLGGAS